MPIFVNAKYMASYAVLFSVLILPARATASPTAPMSVILRSAAADAQQRVACVDITITFVTPPIAQGQPFLKIPLLTSNVVTVAKTIESLSINDESGPLAAYFKDDPESGEITYRHWISSRATKGKLTVYYRAPISNLAAPRGAAPPLELRSNNGAFSGAGETFLVQPKTDSPQPLEIHWDLSAMGNDTVGISSFGKGDVTSTRTCAFSNPVTLWWKKSSCILLLPL
jgi:hypothetical protein